MRRLLIDRDFLRRHRRRADKAKSAPNVIPIQDCIRRQSVEPAPNRRRRNTEGPSATQPPSAAA